MNLPHKRRGRNPRGTGVPINYNGRTAGYFDPTTKVHTRRWLRTHLVRAFNGIAYNREVIEELAGRECKILENTNPETGAVYRVAFDHFTANAQPFDFGHGAQLALPLSFWAVDGGQAPVSKPEPAKAPAWMQAGLFEVTA